MIWVLQFLLVRTMSNSQNKIYFPIFYSMADIYPADIARYLLILSIIFIPINSQGAIFKCSDENGHIEYRQRPCRAAPQSQGQDRLDDAFLLNTKEKQELRQLKQMVIARKEAKLLAEKWLQTATEYTPQGIGVIDNIAIQFYGDVINLFLDLGSECKGAPDVNSAHIRFKAANTLISQLATFSKGIMFPHSFSHGAMVIHASRKHADWDLGLRKSMANLSAWYGEAPPDYSEAMQQYHERTSSTDDLENGSIKTFGAEFNQALRILNLIENEINYGISLAGCKEDELGWIYNWTLHGMKSHNEYTSQKYDSFLDNNYNFWLIDKQLSLDKLPLDDRWPMTIVGDIGCITSDKGIVPFLLTESGGVKLTDKVFSRKETLQTYNEYILRSATQEQVNRMKEVAESLCSSKVKQKSIKNPDIIKYGVAQENKNTNSMISESSITNLSCDILVNNREILSEEGDLLNSTTNRKTWFDHTLSMISLGCAF